MTQKRLRDSTPAARWVMRAACTWMACLCLALPVRAAPIDDLMGALRISEMVEVMRDEGMTYGSELADDLLPGGDSLAWQVLVSDIYDNESMLAVVEKGFAGAIAETDVDPLMAFFNSDLGKRIVDLELSARKAMVDDAVEEAAREKYRSLQGSEDPRLAQIQRFVEVNDLLEANVSGALNASYRFYSGLVDGGALRLSESEILSDVWQQEESTREDTREWVYAYLLLAYEPLSDEDLEAYIALTETAQGRALNQALFAGFNNMYDTISYALGLAAARLMQQQEL
ncbi:DUF2059 domain-containing protein [Mameliella sediminis]|uniref:DUF2059 domain-containing protein n=1 Tax=Mameliella sediminis TaxID=2836866 RepID=UPI001FEAA438|nr:DUF2059 domain-containing protein [Mameliella sediminis]